MGGSDCSACEEGNYPQRYLIHAISLCQTRVNDSTSIPKYTKYLCIPDVVTMTSSISVLMSCHSIH